MPDGSGGGRWVTQAQYRGVHSIRIGWSSDGRLTSSQPPGPHLALLGMRRAAGGRHSMAHWAGHGEVSSELLNPQAG